MYYSYHACIAYVDSVLLSERNVLGYLLVGYGFGS